MKSNGTQKTGSTLADAKAVRIQQMLQQHQAEYQQFAMEQRKKRKQERTTNTAGIKRISVAPEVANSATVPPTLFALLRMMDGQQKLSLVLDVFDILSDFLYAYSIDNTHTGFVLPVLVFAFIGLALQAVKWLVLRRSYMRKEDAWDRTQALIVVGYAILLLEDIPQIILVVLATANDTWHFFAKLSIGISCLSCLWKLSQELFLALECTVIDNSHSRKTYMELCCAKVCAFGVDLCALCLRLCAFTKEARKGEENEMTKVRRRPENQDEESQKQSQLKREQKKRRPELEKEEKLEQKAPKTPTTLETSATSSNDSMQTSTTAPTRVATSSSMQASASAATQVDTPSSMQASASAATQAEEEGKKRTRNFNIENLDDSIVDDSFHTRKAYFVSIEEINNVFEDFSLGLCETLHSFLPKDFELVYNGRIYRTLDAISYSCTENCNQKGTFLMPKGYNFAICDGHGDSEDFNEVLINVIKKYSWGCCALIIGRKNRNIGHVSLTEALDSITDHSHKRKMHFEAYRTGNMIKGTNPSAGAYWDGHAVGRLIERSEDGISLKTNAGNKWNYQRKILLRSIESKFEKL